MPVLLVVVVHVLLQVHVEVLKDHVELLVRMDDIQQLDHIRVLELLQEGDLSDGGAGDAFGLAERKDECVLMGMKQYARKPM